MVFKPVKLSSTKSECFLISNLLSKYLVQVSSKVILVIPNDKKIIKAPLPIKRTFLFRITNSLNLVIKFSAFEEPIFFTLLGKMTNKAGNVTTA